MFVQGILKKVYQQADNNDIPRLVFITGASGAGKTTLLSALHERLQNTATVCLHFDSIGVPSLDTMIARYGSGSEWQKAMTYQWVKRIRQNYCDQQYVILEGQVNLDFITAACSSCDIHHYKIVLLHCENAIRHHRLSKFREQPELIYAEMDDWAVYLKQQAIARRALILDSGLLSIQQMVDSIEQLLRQRDSI